MIKRNISNLYISSPPLSWHRYEFSFYPSFGIETQMFFLFLSLHRWLWMTSMLKTSGTCWRMPSRKFRKKTIVALVLRNFIGDIFKLNNELLTCFFSRSLIFCPISYVKTQCNNKFSWYTFNSHEAVSENKYSRIFIYWLLYLSTSCWFCTAMDAMKKFIFFFFSYFKLIDFCSS